VAFKKGHIISEKDIPHLERIGKNHIYVLELGNDELHEDDAALIMAPALAGEGIEFDPSPSEGKISYRSTRDGLFKVDTDALLSLNMLGDVMLATLHDNSVVKKGVQVAAGRAIPLVVSKAVVDRAVEVGTKAREGVISVKPFIINSAALVITGREVYEGKIKDAFGPAMSEKFARYGIDVISSVIVPDDKAMITDAVVDAAKMGAGIILCTGGMSVDPDDVTRSAIREAGVSGDVYGTPVLPGAMFMVSYLGDIPVLGIPACGMFFKTTVLDIVLPRILAGERLGRREIAALGHGGLCLGCSQCRYPVCPFGKGGK
jgi:hypothetical protein